MNAKRESKRTNPSPHSLIGSLEQILVQNLGGGLAVEIGVSVDVDVDVGVEQRGPAAARATRVVRKRSFIVCWCVCVLVS